MSDADVDLQFVQTTISRMELLSALLFSKLISSICTTLLDSELSLDHSLCFTDSKPALSKESTICGNSLWNTK